MASVINKTPNPESLQYTYLDSVNTPDYDPLYWVHNPDVHELQSTEVPQKYWKTESYYEDSTTEILWRVVEMSDTEKAAVDAKIPTPPPVMPDGRPIIRADTRPLNTSTYFTMAGDDSTSIGGGVELRWDFSNDDDLYTGPEVPSGYKCKQLLISFHCPINTKDGTIYFFDAPWGQYLYMDIVVPAGNYYPNPAGPIPASALGLSGSTMYSYASTNVPVQKFINKHFMYGSCPMGDELNSEGAAVDALPIGWYIRGLIITPNSDNISKGFGSLEMYRCHSELLPGQTIESLHG